MICRKCHKETPDGSRFCILCGASQEVKPSHKQRGNGQGSVFRTASGTWAAEITLGYYIKDGVSKRKMKRKCGFKTKREAVLYLDTLRSSEVKPSVPTMSSLWETFSGSWALSKSKQCAYRVAWRKIADEVGYRTADSFSSDELQAIVDSSAPSYYTRRDIKTVFSKLFQLAMRDDFVDKNKAEFIKLPKLSTAEREIFTSAEVALLWADFGIKKEPITAQMLTMLYTGMRPGELLGVKVENVALSEHYLTGGIKTEKGKRRKIVIPQKLDTVIHYMLDTSRCGRLAYYNKPSEFYEAWIAKRQALGIREALSPYCCRHTYVTNVTALGASPAMLQELVGHEDYDTTLIYTHLSVADRLAVVNRL